MLRSTGVAVFRSPFHFLYCQTYRGGLSIYRKFRVKISTRSAYLFGASIIRGAFGRHIGNFRRTFIFHCVALLSVYSLPGICSGGSFWFKFPFKILFRACGKSSVQFPDNIPTFRHVNEYAVAIGKRKYCFAVRCAGRYNGSPSGKPQHVVHIVPAKLDCVNL